MTRTKNNAQNIISILIGGLLMGFLWRVRGTHGWGSSWGLLSAGLLYTLFVIMLLGERKKLNIGWFSLTVASFMLTSPAWGTFLSQITGVLYSESSWINETGGTVYTSVGAAIFIMLCTGLGMAAIFGIMLGRGFSDKQWKIKDFIILLAVFYGTYLLSELTVSHWILNLIQPEAAELFEKGLVTSGYDMSAYEAFVKNLGGISWAKKIDGGRNYFASIITISSAIRCICALISVRFITKDKTAAKIGAVVSGAFAFSITVSDLFFYFANGGYHMEGTPAFTEFIAAWSCWEYFTGFIAGIIITAVLVFMKKREDVPENTFDFVPRKVQTVLTFILSSIFVIGFSIARPIMIRNDETEFALFFTILAVLVAIVSVTLINYKWGLNLKNTEMLTFSRYMLPLFTVFTFIVYMFMGDEPCYRDINRLHTVMVIVSFVAVLGWCAGQRKIKNK